MTKGILFNQDMVRAILDGRKTVTRRVIKPQPTERLTRGNNWEQLLVSAAAPYQPGDTLYVRETWSDDRQFTKDSTPGRYFYKASESDEFTVKWKPSIHMPKEAARIFLKVKDVRVERLQEITEEQAKAEGIREYSKDGKLWKYAVTDDWWIEYHHKYRKFFTGSWWHDMPRTAKEAFHHLWNSTLGRRDTPEWYANNWSGNPWVWVIEFERCEKPENF